MPTLCKKCKKPIGFSFEELIMRKVNVRECSPTSKESLPKGLCKECFNKEVP